MKSEAFLKGWLPWPSPLTRYGTIVSIQIALSFNFTIDDISAEVQNPLASLFEEQFPPRVKEVPTP